MHVDGDHHISSYMFILAKKAREDLSIRGLNVGLHTQQLATGLLWRGAPVHWWRITQTQFWKISGWFSMWERNHTNKSPQPTFGRWWENFNLVRRDAWYSPFTSRYALQWKHQVIQLSVLKSKFDILEVWPYSRDTWFAIYFYWQSESGVNEDEWTNLQYFQIEYQMEILFLSLELCSKLRSHKYCGGDFPHQADLNFQTSSFLSWIIDFWSTYFPFFCFHFFSRFLPRSKTIIFSFWASNFWHTHLHQIR